MNKHITKIIEAIPDYNHFLPIEELDASSHALVAKYPNLARIKTVGYSRDNHPIKMLCIGNGSYRALFVGCPHPNEPIGIMSLEYLSQILCSNKHLLEQFDYTFYIIKVIDVDGYRLNQGWLKGPYTPDSYIKGFFRPPLEEQPEWTFPYEYKTFKFSLPSPETKAFMCAIDETQPHFLNSLHNASETGTFFYLSEIIPEEIHSKLKTFIQKYNLPIMCGEPEMDFMPVLTDGFYLIPRFSQIYDFYESILPQGTDPALMLKAGACSADYALKYDTFTLISEITLFGDSRMADITPTNQIRRDVIQTNLEKTKKHFSFFYESYQLSLRHINKKTRFQSAIEGNSKILEHIFLHQTKLANTTDHNYLRYATVAELFDNETRYQWILLNTASMFVRMVEAQETNPELEKLHAKVKPWFEDYLVNLLDKLNYKVQPLRDLSAIQIESALTVMEYIKRKGS